MVDRIKQLLEWQQLTPTQFADRIGIGRPVVSHILSERNKASLEVARSIKKAFPELSYDWLLEGTGSMLEATAPATQTAPVAGLPVVPAAIVPATSPIVAPLATAAATAPIAVAAVAPVAPAAAAVPPVPATSVAPTPPAPQALALPVQAAAAKALATGTAIPAFRAATGRADAPARPALVVPPRFRPAGVAGAAPATPVATGATEAVDTVEGRPAAPKLLGEQLYPSPAEATGASLEPIVSPATGPLPGAQAGPVLQASRTADATLTEALAAGFAEPGKAIRRIVIFYRDGSFADYQPES